MVNTSITRSDQQLPEKLLHGNIDLGRQVKHIKDNGSPNNATILELSCNGEVDLFGRRHFIGILPRAVNIVKALPLEMFGFNTDSSLIQYWIEYAGLTVLPREEFAGMINILGFNITTEHSQLRKRSHNLLKNLNH